MKPVVLAGPPRWARGVLRGVPRIWCVVLLLAACASARPLVTLALPEDVQVVPPLASIPAPQRALSGAWAGTWICPGGVQPGATTFEAVLVVERLGETEATIVYAWGQNVEELAATGWTRAQAELGPGPQLRWVAPNRTFTFTLHEDGNALRGTVWIAPSHDEIIDMTRARVGR